MVGQLNPGVWVLGFNHHAKKGSKMVVMMDLDKNPSTASYGAPFCFHIISFNIDVGVMINDLITWGKGGGVLIKELHNSDVMEGSHASTMAQLRKIRTSTCW